MEIKMVQISDFFVFKLSYDTPAFKVLVSVSDLEFGSEVNEYYYYF